MAEADHLVVRDRDRDDPDDTAARGGDVVGTGGSDAPDRQQKGKNEQSHRAR